jgi:hypothetical protein
MLFGLDIFSSPCMMGYYHSFKTRPSPASLPGTRPTWGWNRARLKKKLGVTRLTRRLDQKPGYYSLTFVFFTKTTSFLFFKKKIDPSDPVKTRNPGLGPDRV